MQCSKILLLFKFIWKYVSKLIDDGLNEKFKLFNHFISTKI